MTACDPHTIYLELRQRLEAYIRARVKDEELTKDILQDVFIKVTECRNGQKQCRFPKSYIFRMAHNLVQDHYRAQKSAAPPPFDTDEADNFNEAMIACLQPVMALLPEKYREALRLADIEQLPQKQVAARLGIGLSGAKSRIQRGREQLRQLMVQACHVEADVYGNILRCERRV